MSVPELSTEERRSALNQAVQARRERADIKAKLKKREINLEDVLKIADENEVIGRAKVSEILRSIPRIGEKSALRIMTELDISESRRIRGLGTRQREALLEQIGKTAK